MTCAGAVAMRTLYIEPQPDWRLPADPTVVSVSPLLRELIDEATRLPMEYERAGRDGKVVELLLLLLLTPRPVPALHLPASTDPQLLGLCEAIRQAPGRPWTTSLAAAYTLMSPRSLQRRFTAATGLSLARWVQQARLIHAVTLLARNTPVTAVATGLGYATPSAFTAMFRRAVGTTPSAYFADAAGAHRQAGSQ